MSNQESNLNKLIDSGLIKEFVFSCNGVWTHEDWLNFCKKIVDGGFVPIDFAKVGLILENEKKLQAVEGKHKFVNICCPNCMHEIIKPLYYFEQEHVICNCCYADISSNNLKVRIDEIKRRL